MSPDPELSPSALMANYSRQPIRFVRGRGCTLFDDAGKQYLDGFSGVAVSSLGHAHPGLVEAVTQQVNTLVHVSNHYEIPEQEALARRITDNSFPGEALLGNSGTEAIEAAIKLARLWSNVANGGSKPVLVAFENAFHGRTLGSLSITAYESYRRPFEPLLPATFLSFGDFAAAAERVREDVAAVFVEIIQGEGGLDTAPPGFLRHLRALCDEAGALLVVDEIQTGVGRTGTMFAYQQEGIEPDILALAKGLGGGIPIGAIVARHDVARLLTPGLHGSTFGGNPLACAAANAVLDVVSAPGFLDHVNSVASLLEQGLRDLFPDRVILGRGLLRGVRLEEPVSELIGASARRRAARRAVSPKHAAHRAAARHHPRRDQDPARRPLPGRHRPVRVKLDP